jgi:hypothetical protein
MPYFFAVRTIGISLLALVGTLVATVILSNQAPAAMQLSPTLATVAIGGTTSVAVMVSSNTPVNAYTGEIEFDSDRFSVLAIEYNTSIADLWVEEPWHNRADNTIYFAGGTTARGGFTGRGELLRVTLQAERPGDSAIRLRNPRILAHDGLGSDVLLATPLDALFTADTAPYALTLPETSDKLVTIVPLLPPLDVNQDGVLGFQDISVLLVHLGSRNAAYDFTGDGIVSWSDIRTWQDLRSAR